jgi:hypothetical protein
MGLRPPDHLPNVLRLSQETGWTWWRVRPTPGVPFANTQFPVEAAEEFQKQAIPDFNAILPAANPTFNHLATLANDLNSHFLMFPNNLQIADLIIDWIRRHVK